MFDFIPVQVLLLIAIGAFAISPVSYISDHIAHSPRRRDITLPPEDLSWRTPPALWGNVALVAGLAALAVFIFTPAAEKLAQSDLLPPVVAAKISAFVLWSVWRDYRDGKVAPLIKHMYTAFDRTTQPKRYWTALSWNAFVGAGFAWLATVMILDAPEERCFAAGTEETAQTKLSACSDLLVETEGAEEQADILAARGIAYALLNDNQRALVDYSRSIAFEADANTLYNRALIHEELGDRPKALADYDAAIKLHSEDPDFFFNRGLLHLDAGSLEPAIHDFTRAHELDPEDHWALANRGVAYAWFGDAVSARADFDQVRKVEPNNQVLLRGEAILSIKAGKLTTAINQLSTALKHHPNDRWTLETRADIYWELGRREEAWADNDRAAMLESMAQANPAP